MFSPDLTPQKITPQNFRPYGWVIEYPRRHFKGNKRNLWRIILTESKTFGWRIAYLVVRDKKIKRMEMHPFSFESFEPVAGQCLMYVAKTKDPRRIKCFLLDRPVILRKGIWHGVVTVGPECDIKITENAKVKCVYWPLGFTLSKTTKGV